MFQNAFQSGVSLEVFDPKGLYQKKAISFIKRSYKGKREELCEFS